MKIDLDVINKLLFTEDEKIIKKYIQILNDNTKTKEATADEVSKILSSAAVYNKHITENIINEAITEQVKGVLGKNTDKSKKDDIISKAPEFKIINEISLGSEVKNQSSGMLIDEENLSINHYQIQLPKDEEIIGKFTIKNEEHKFFESTDKTIHNQYIKAFKFSKFVADHIEDNNTINNGLAYKHAYDMLVCFGNTNNQTNQKKQKVHVRDIISQYVKTLNEQSLNNGLKPVHDSFSTFSLPKNREKF